MIMDSCSQKVRNIHISSYTRWSLESSAQRELSKGRLCFSVLSPSVHKNEKRSAGVHRGLAA